MLKIKKFPGRDNIDIIKTCTSFIGRPFMKVYFLRIDNVFIDSGNSGCSASALTAYLKNLPERKSWIVLNTHMHEDHCGNNGLIREVLGADVFAPEIIDIAPEMSLLFRIFWGRPYKCDCRKLKDDIIITDAGRRIRVIPAPGHTDCHRCYFIEDENILITGDAIPFPVRKAQCLYGEDYRAIIENLKSLKKFIDDSAIFLTAHQGILPDPRTAIEKRIDSMEEAVKIVLKAWDDNSRDISKTAETVFGKPGLLDRMIAPRMSYINTVKSIVRDCYDNPVRCRNRKKSADY